MDTQTPFVTIFLELDPEDEYLEYTALIIEEILKQRIQGVKNEIGMWITPVFPKIVYVIDEHNSLRGGKYDYLTRLASECTSKRFYPDYISAKIMRETYEGNVFSPMGCVDGQEVITYKFENKVFIETFVQAWSKFSKMFEVKKQQNMTDEYIDLVGVEIVDTKEGFVECKRLIRNTQCSWINITLDGGYDKIRKLSVTIDHPFETETRGIVLAKDLRKFDIIICSNFENERKTNRTKEDLKYEAFVKEKSFFYHRQYAYDVETSSGHFEVSGVYSHNCRSFLSPYKNKDGEYIFEGRFNQGVISLNLPQVALEVTKGGTQKADKEQFMNELKKRLDICFDALMYRHNALLGTTSDISPIHWQHGAIARLGKGEVIDEYLNSPYSTLSLGFIGVYECTLLMTGESHTTPKGHEFAIEVMSYLKDKVDYWKTKTGLGFALYSTPSEGLCFRFAKIDEKKYGIIKDITDKEYYTNSYHVDVREEIDAFTKLKFESEFQKISTGGCISYIEVPNLQNNVEAIQEVIKFIYENVQYGEFNMKTDCCHECQYEGEILLDDNNEWHCPNCGNRDTVKMNIVRRTCGLTKT